MEQIKIKSDCYTSFLNVEIILTSRDRFFLTLLSTDEQSVHRPLSSGTLVVEKDLFVVGVIV